MRVVQASGEKEQWILSTSDQPVSFKDDPKWNSKVSQLFNLCTVLWDTEGVWVAGADAPLVRGGMV